MLNLKLTKITFYDSYPQCSKCCFYVNLLQGAMALAILSLIIRVYLLLLQKQFWLQKALSDHGNSFDIYVVLLDHFISGALGTIADVLLLLGVFQKKQKYVRLYLPIMFLVFFFEILFYFVSFVLGYHWLHVLEILLYGAFHVWCWFTAHSLNQQWNTFVPSSVNTPENGEPLPSAPEE